MSYGDKLMAIGDAWKQYHADPRRRPVAIGDGRRIDVENLDLAWGLDFLATAQQVSAGEDVSWLISYPHHRPYVDYAAMREASSRMLGWKRWLPWKSRKPIRIIGRYIFRLDYRPTPAPIHLKPEEEEIAERWAQAPFVVIEPFIKSDAPPSKQWPIKRFAAVAREMSRQLPVYQLSAPGSPELDGLPQIRPRSFRESLAYLKAAKLYIGPEGGLHHGAAAMNTRAVVIYGGFTSPLVTGYDFHVNLTGGATYACGTRRGMCPHCRELLENISATEVVEHARRLIN